MGSYLDLFINRGVAKIDMHSEAGSDQMSNSNKKINNEAKLKKEIIGLKTELEAAKGKGLSINKLKNEHNFIEYVRMLRSFSKRYMLIISASDTPCGSSYTEEVSSEVMQLSLRIDLCQKFRHGYAAIINAGTLEFESLSPTVYEWVEHKCYIEDVSVEVVSIGFDAPKTKCAHIVINGRDYSTNRRGLNFVVFDKVTKTVLDAVNFDTYSENFSCNRPSEITDGLIAYKETHPDVSVLCFSGLAFPEQNRSANEEFILKHDVSRGLILQNLDKPVFALNQYFSDAENIREVLRVPKSYHDINGARRFEDGNGKCVNIAGGHRVTEGQPQIYKRTIFIVGGCVIFGIGASDKGTLASYLQKLFNELAPGQQFIVQNYGFYIAEVDAVTGEELSILNSLPVKAGDIILCNFAMTSELPCLDLSSAAKRPHEYGEVFFDPIHYTEDGYRLIADRLFEKLQQLNFFSDEFASASSQVIAAQQEEDNSYNLDAESRKKLQEYKRILTDFYHDMFDLRIGAIVMNANPFTLGHRYLVEQAAANCHHLIIFVVEEDKSIFSFDDRLKLVEDGTADLENVTVVPSSKFIISSLTFSEYFNKSELQDHVVDSSMDVTLFAREIAPCLQISARFVGEEPHDKVTKQYNNTMRAILPEYGIEFVEIPRKELDGRAISASLVRTLLKERNFDEIAKLVPKTTLGYLTERFSSITSIIKKLKMNAQVL